METTMEQWLEFKRLGKPCTYHGMRLPVAVTIEGVRTAWGRVILEIRPVGTQGKAISVNADKVTIENKGSK